jgi:hypothetical protein
MGGGGDTGSTESGGDTGSGGEAGTGAGAGSGGETGSGGEAGAGGSETIQCQGTCCDQSAIPAFAAPDFNTCKSSLLAACAGRGGPSLILVDGQSAERESCRYCRVDCCDGSLFESSAYADAPTCYSAGSTQCGPEGPTGAAYNGAAWTMPLLACPSQRECNLTCCNGDESLTSSLGAASCVEQAMADRFCDARGGRQRVDFDGAAAWSDNVCARGDYNCVSTCCDGSQSYWKHGASNDCAFYGPYACEHDGGPQRVQFESMDVFTPDVSCPTARSCILRCCDGFEFDRSPGFSKSGCAFFNASASVCKDEGHGANKELLFGGESVWTAACP